MPDEIDTYGTDYPVCPHCGHKEDDYSEMTNAGTYNCPACEKEYYLEPDFSVSFTTSKVCKKCGSEPCRTSEVDLCFRCERDSQEARTGLLTTR